MPLGFNAPLAPLTKSLLKVSIPRTVAVVASEHARNVSTFAPELEFLRSR